MCGPVLGNKLSVDPEAEAVVGLRADAIGARFSRGHEAGPAGRKVFRLEGAGFEARNRCDNEIEVDVLIDASNGSYPFQIESLEVLGLETGFAVGSGKQPCRYGLGIAKEMGSRDKCNLGRRKLLANAVERGGGARWRAVVVSLENPCVVGQRSHNGDGLGCGSKW